MLELITDNPIIWTLCTFFAVAYVIGIVKDTVSSDVNAPFGLRYLKLTPRWLANAIYAWDAIYVIGKGYHQVRGLL